MSAVNKTDEGHVKLEECSDDESKEKENDVIIPEQNIKIEDLVAETPPTNTSSQPESQRVLKIEPFASASRACSSRELKVAETNSQGNSLPTSNTTTKSGTKASPPVYKNGFINFLKELESDRKYSQHTALDRIREAAALWRALPDGTKRCYKDQSETDLLGGLASSLTALPKLPNTALGKKVLRNLEMMLERQKGGEAACSSGHLRPRRRRTNPYMNFLAEYRQEPENAHMPQAKVVVRGAKIWSSMTPAEKSLYQVPAQRSVPAAKKLPRQSVCSLEKSTESFMMFVRYFSDFVGNLTPTELISRATQHWKSLSDWKKKQFAQMAYSKYFKK